MNDNELLQLRAETDKAIEQMNESAKQLCNQLIKTTCLLYATLNKLKGIKS